MKKFKLLALAVMAMLGTNAFAAIGSEFIGNNGIRYKITKEYVAASAGVDEQLGFVTVINYGLSETTDAVVIPEIVGNQDATNTDVPTTNRYKVVGINGTETTPVTIGASTIPVNTTTATQAFKNAKSVSITLPSSLLYIGQQAFEGCQAVTIAIPAGSQLYQIAKGAFANASKLATFDTSNAAWLAKIEEDAFYGCAALTSISLGAKLESIADGAFVGTKITTLDLSACTLLNATNGINRLFTAVKETAYASGLTFGTKTDYVAADEKNASLTTVVLPTTNAVAYPIGADAFNGCTKLATIGSTANAATINAKVASIGARAFYGTAIKVLDLSASTAILAVDDWFTKKTATTTGTLEQIILNNAAYTGFSVVNINTLKKIGISGAEYALPAKTTTGAIVANVFEGTALEQLDLSKITAAIATLPNLFNTTATTPYTSLTAVVLNDRTTELAADAFARCEKLASLTVKDKDGNAKDLKKIITINNGAFYRTALSDFTFGAALTTLTTPFAGTDKEADGTTPKALSTAESISIDLSACTALTSATIAASTFEGLAALTSIKLPTNLAEIGASAFKGTGITEITIPNTVVAGKIGDNAFEASKLKSLTYMPTAAPASTIFGTDPFKSCSLVTIYTNTIYTAVAGAAPTNSKYSTTSPEELTTVKDKVKSYAMKGFYSTGAYQFDAAECDVYEAYVDGENIVLSPLRKRDGKYNVPANNAVIVRTTEVKTINPVAITIDASHPTSMIYGAMTTVAPCAVGENCLQSVATEKARESVPNFGNYMYVLVNNATAGFSFQYFSGTKINKGNIYVINPAKVPAAGRLNMIWLDENGNVVEDETTAIESINATEAAEGEIYNLQGVRVNGAQKGIYIKNGKKFIVK